MIKQIKILIYLIWRLSFSKRFIDRYSNISHHTADLFMDNVEFNIDITEMLK